MFDTHCHLNFEAFKDTYEDVIKRAREEGVGHLLIPGTDIATSVKAIIIASSFKNIYASCGIHPTKDLESLPLKETLLKIKNLASDKKVVAIGEMGLDYYRYRSGPLIQKKYFQEQIKLGLELEKTLIIHNRHAGRDILKILKDNWNPSFEGKCVFHCCEVDYDLLAFAKKKYVFIGCDGDVTYDTQKQDFIKDVPIQLLVVETDSPYILPEPLRSNGVKRNEPKNIKYIIKKISEIKNIEVNEASQKTIENALILYGLK